MVSSLSQHPFAASLWEFNTVSVATRILLSALLGGCIGFGRGRHGRAAGLRTHILVCLGASMTAMVGLYVSLVLGFDNDPMRIAAQVISGIGFLGAGTILTRTYTQITGLTTAAGLWTTASIGLAIGIGFYWGAAIAFVIVLITMTFLSRLEQSVKEVELNIFYLELTDISRVNEFFHANKEKLAEIRVVPAKSGTPANVGVICTLGDTKCIPRWLQETQELEYVAIALPESKHSVEICK